MQLLLALPTLLAVFAAQWAANGAVLPAAVDSRALSNTTDINPNGVCYTGVRIFVARGTLETQGASAQEVYVQRILATIPDSYASEVVYPAAPFWFPLKFLNSVLTGISNAQTEIYAYHTQCPNGKIVLMGYSQGARVMGHAIAGSSLLNLDDSKQLLAIPMPPLCASAGERVAAVVLFGDPGRKLGVGQDAYASALCTTSASSPRDGSEARNFLPYANKLQEWCNKGDPVCCSSGYKLQDHVSYFQPNLTATSLDVVARFVAAKASALAPSSQAGTTACIAFEYDPLISRDEEMDGKE